jgi:nucleotide-binding universal stress UspA family protein
MAMQILVPIHTYPDGNSANLAVHVSTVAKHLKGVVHALLLNVDFPQFHSPLAEFMLDVPTMITSAKARCRENGALLMKAFQEEMAQHEIDLRSTEIEYLPTALADKINESTRYHDLSVLGIGQHEAALRGTAEEVIFGSGKPVLLVPEDREAGSYEHVAIAWDGSRVAARAVADAWPFLEGAGSITILCVNDEKPLPHRDIGSRLADYLAKHEFKAEVANIQTHDHPIADTLQDHAAGIGAGLLIMGGFGHSRMRDFVLGGATSGILRGLRLPALLSH